MNYTAEFCIRAIVDDNDVAFDSLLHELAEEIQMARISKDVLRSKWVFDIPVCCTLCDNSKFIAKVQEVRKQLKHGLEFYIQPSLELAKALKFEKCSEELMKLTSAPVSERYKTDEFSIFASVLKIGQIYRVIDEMGVTVRVLKRLCENGFDVCSRGHDLHRTVLHEAIVQMYTSYEVYDAIFALGGDVNSHTKYIRSGGGISAYDKDISAFLLYVICARNYKCDKGQLTKILKLFLFQNPSLAETVDWDPVNMAIDHDRLSFPKASYLGPQQVVRGQRFDCHGDAASLKCIPSEAELYFLPWLYTCGFHLSKTHKNAIQLYQQFGYLKPYDSMFDHPRHLKEIARIAIRRWYGRQLHTAINSLKLPSSLKDYILMKELIN